nr:cation transporter [Propionibacterium sp.]
MASVTDETDPRPGDDDLAEGGSAPVSATALRRTVLLVALLNLAYFFVEIGVALGIGSVSLFADSVDFLEDTAVNLLIFVALGFSLRWRAVMGRVMAGIIVLPAVAALAMAVAKFADPTPPDPLSLAVTAGGAIVINALCAALLYRVRHHGGSMSAAAFLAARNDVIANAAIIGMALVTGFTASGWPDILLGLLVVALNATAAREVWELAGAEDLAARALAGEDLDDD